MPWILCKSWQSWQESYVHNDGWDRKTHLHSKIFSGIFLFEAPDVSVSNDLSEFIGQELSKSDRPELTSAKAVISGGKYLHMYTLHTDPTDPSWKPTRFYSLCDGILDRIGKNVHWIELSNCNR